MERRYEAGMVGFWNRFDPWLGRLSGLATFWPLLPSGVLGVIGAYLSTSVAWINANLGAWGWFMSGLAAFVISCVGIALIVRTRLWMVNMRFRARLQSDSSPFDPMATVYHDKRLFLKDLAPPGRREIKGKTFKNCEIIGPGNIVVALRSNELKPFPEFVNNVYYDVDCIQIQPGVLSNNAIYFGDCDFDGCQFYNLNLLFYHRMTDSWHWITPIVAETHLLESGNDEQPDQ